MLYIGDKGVNVAARPPEGGPAEAGGLSASNLPLISIPHPARMPDGPEKAKEVCLCVCVSVCLCLSECVYVLCVCGYLSLLSTRQDLTQGQ